MATFSTSGATPNKTWYSVGTGGLCILLVVLEFLPQNQRSLLLKDDAVGPAKAFAAVVAPLDPDQSRLERGVLDHLSSVSDGVRKRRRVGQGRAGGQQVFADAGTSPVPTGLPADAGAKSALSDAGRAPVGGSGAAPSFGGFLAANSPAPLGAGSTTSSTSSGGSTGGTNSSSGGPTTSTGGLTSSTGGSTTSTGGLTSSTGGTVGGTTTTTSGGTTPPVSAVPEPGTWLTMLVGFFMIGGIIRRRSRSLLTA